MADVTTPNKLFFHAMTTLLLNKVRILVASVTTTRLRYREV